MLRVGLAVAAISNQSIGKRQASKSQATSDRQACSLVMVLYGTVFSN